MRNRLLLLVIAACLLPFAAWGQTVVKCGAADDTPAINAAVAGNYSFVRLIGPCNVTSINLASKQGVILEGEGNLRTRLQPLTNGANVIDLTGSSNITLRNFWLCGVCSPAIVPNVGILAAQMQGNYNSDSIFIEHVRVDGNFATASFYNLGVASSTVTKSQFYNARPSMVVLFTANNYFGVASQYVSISTTQYVPSDWTFVGTEIHSLTTGFGFFIGGSTAIRYYGGNIASSLYPVSLSGASQLQPVNPNFIIMDGTTFYNDQAPVPPCAVQGQAGMPPVHFRANEAPFPLTGC